ncbi:MAG: hypothetical protein M0036_13325 [Desulfobacteraceae bacterium]|nr:hypothetical protein [Desulfobacteraceae bacterium]
MYFTADADSHGFDSNIYLRMLVAIAKSDKENGPPEYAFVRRQARRLGLDYEQYLNSTDKSFILEKQKVSRLTALSVIRDAILLASLDHNFTLAEKQKVYSFAEKLDITRRDVDAVEVIVRDFQRVNDSWRQLVQTN